MTSGWSPVWVSATVACTSTAIVVAIGTVLAFWRSRSRARWAGIVDAVVLAPMVLPPTVVGLLLLTAFGRHSPVGEWLALLGVRIVFSWTGAVIAAVTVSLPLYYVLARASFSTVDRDLVDAARVFGLGEWRILREVVLPLAAPGIWAGTVLAFARGLGEFGATLMLAGNIPGQTQTLPVAVYFAVEAGDRWEAAGYAAVLLSISVLAIAAANLAAKRQFH